MPMLPKPAGFDNRVHHALKAYRRDDRPEQGLLTDLLLYQRLHHINRSPRQITDAIIATAMQLLRNEEATYYEVLRCRFVEKLNREQTARRLATPKPTIDRKQRLAIRLLADLIWRQEVERRLARQQSRLAEFPQPDYETLFGVDDALLKLQELIAASRQRHILVITGLGGVGKSSLADKLARQLALTPRYKRFLWLRVPADAPGRRRPPAEVWDLLLSRLSERLAPQATFSSPQSRAIAVQERLRQAACFVVVDNIEMSDVVTYLITELLLVAGNSQFVLTSRSRPDTLSPADIFELSELSQADALDLLRFRLRTEQPAGWRALKSADLRSLYHLTGGNPMALILTVGLLHTMPFKTVLTGLEEGRIGPIESLYLHIYRAIWHELSRDAKDLLLSMLLVGADEGAAPTDIMAGSGLDEHRFWNAVNELRQASLLEARGTMQEQRFGIHHLTQTFLRAEVLL